MFSLLIVASLAGGVPGQDRPAIAGTVQGETGEPLKGATVFISTAAPRKGVGVL